MTNTEPLDLDAIRQRANAATPGPWTVDTIPETGESRVLRRYPDVESILWPSITSGGSVVPDAEFIAHAREDVPALVAALRESEETAKSYMKMYVGIVETVIEVMGVKGDGHPLPADLAECECQGEGGTRHLIWHLGERSSALALAEAGIKALRAAMLEAYAATEAGDEPGNILADALGIDGHPQDGTTKRGQNR